MAAFRLVFTAEGITLVTTGGWKTAIQLLAPTHQRVEILSYGANPRGVTNSSPPVRLRLVRQTSAGTGGTPVTAEKRSSGGSETPQTTALKGPFSAEPTLSGGALDLQNTHPQQGMEEPALIPEQYVMFGAERWALQYWNDAGEANLVTDFNIAVIE